MGAGLNATDTGEIPVIVDPMVEREGFAYREIGDDPTELTHKEALWASLCRL